MGVVLLTGCVRWGEDVLFFVISDYKLNIIVVWTFGPIKQSNLNASPWEVIANTLVDKTVSRIDNEYKAAT